MPKATASSKSNPKTKAKTTKTAAKHPAPQVYRFAHPFFTTTPASRKLLPGVAGKQLTAHVAAKLEKIPDPIRTPPVMSLSDIIGKADADAIAATNSIAFQAVGDTGHIGGGTENMQEYVADAMAADFDIARPEI
jgi:hypothetical protein